MIRHGQTPGNALKRYIGRTDEPLSEAGQAQAGLLASKAPGVRLQRTGEKCLLVVSPMLRCVQTAALMLGDHFSQDEPAGQILGRLREAHRLLDIRICEDLRECDFGTFEGKNYKELSGDPLYQQWIDSGGTLPFPEGENPSGFRERCCSAFSRIIKENTNGTAYLCMVAHGGTIMSLMERWGRDEAGEKHEYYQWHTRNGCGLRVRLTLKENGLPDVMDVLERIE